MPCPGSLGPAEVPGAPSTASRGPHVSALRYGHGDVREGVVLRAGNRDRPGGPDPEVVAGDHVARYLDGQGGYGGDEHTGGLVVDVRREVRVAIKVIGAYLVSGDNVAVKVVVLS
jgi:hypothetical protein